MYGILTPLLVRPIKDGTYEIISGHRRKRAAALLGYRKIPVLIQPMSYEDAVVKMVDTNLHREHISFSEKAFAYRMKNEAMKQKGTRSIASTSKIKSRLTAALVINSFESRPADLVTTVTDHPERTGRYHPYVSESLLRDIRSNHTVLGCLPLLFPQCCR